MSDIICQRVRETVYDILTEYSISVTDNDLQNTTLYKMGIDSLMFIELVIKLEDEFGITIPTEYLSYNEMSTTDRITEIVEKVKERETT